MSFLVRYLVGNTIHRDHQYWPTITRDEWKVFLVAHGRTAAEAEAFVARYDNNAMNLATLMQLAWRVREWTVSAGSFTYAGVNVFFPSNAWTAGGSWSAFPLRMKRANPLRDVTSEEDILGPPTDYPSGDTFGDWPTLRNAGIQGDKSFTASAFDQEPLSATAVLAINLLGGYIMYNPSLELFYPLIIADGFCFFGSETFSANVEFGTRSYGPPTVGGTLTLVNSISGANITLPLYIRGGHTPTSVEGAGTVNITITATQWWPYKNSRDEPVYNTTNGQILNDPFA